MNLVNFFMYYVKLNFENLCGMYFRFLKVFVMIFENANLSRPALRRIEFKLEREEEVT